MSCTVPSCDDAFVEDSAPAGMVRMFLDKEESARVQESKTGEAKN